MLSIRRILLSLVGLTVSTALVTEFAHGQESPPSQLRFASYEFIGPDSVNWREIQQMDVSWYAGLPARIAVATRIGVAARMGAGWVYPLKNGLSYDWDTYDNYYKAVFFSPWNDSVAFTGRDIQSHFSGEPTSIGAQVVNVYNPVWAYRDFGGAWPLIASSCYVFPPHDTGMVLGNATYLFKSTDNGVSWTRLSYSWRLIAMAADRTRDSVYYVLVSTGSIPMLQKSEDNAQTWTLVSQILLSFLSRTTLLADGSLLILSKGTPAFTSDSASGIYRSTDQGRTWRHVYSHAGIEDVTVDPDHNQRLFAVTSNLVLVSNDGGERWTPVSVAIPSSRFVSVKKAPGGDTLYIATAEAGIYRIFDIPLSVNEQYATPRTMSLGQNFPNPFNPTTTIGYELAKSGLVTLKIYDMLGQELATLVDGFQLQGRYQTAFHAGDLASGVYFYKLMTSGTTLVRKMMLAK